MYSHTFITAGFTVSIALLMVAMPATALAGWSNVTGARQQHHATQPGERTRRLVPPAVILVPQSPFLEANPNSYLYPQPVQPREPREPRWPRQPYAGRDGAQQQWRESQWHDRERIEQEQRAWRDWGQHDRSDRFSREREGRERNWSGRQQQESRDDQRTTRQFDSGSTQNGPIWDYREHHR